MHVASLLSSGKNNVHALGENESSPDSQRIAPYNLGKKVLCTGLGSQTEGANFSQPVPAMVLMA